MRDANINRLAAAACCRSFTSGVSPFDDAADTFRFLPEDYRPFHRERLGFVHFDANERASVLMMHAALLDAQHHMAAAAARIRRLEAELESLKELVCEDVLTHCLNRRGLQQALQRESARGVRQLQPLCIALLDLDDFKRVNDHWGHQAGDEALIHLVQVARASLRSTDLLGRYGGEEFMVVMPNTSMQAAEHAIARIQRALTEAPLAFGATQLRLTFSAGVAMQNSDEDSDATAERADQALYSAKRNGKNRIVTTY